MPSSDISDFFVVTKGAMNSRYDTEYLTAEGSGRGLSAAGDSETLLAMRRQESGRR